MNLVRHGEDVSGESFQSLLERSRAALDSGDRTTALLGSQLLVERYPGEPSGYLLHARALTAQGKSAEALQLLRQSWPMHEANPKALSMMRTLASAQASLDAIDFAQRLLELAPNDRKNLAFLVEWHLEAKELQTALAHSETLVGSHPGEPKSWKLKAQVLMALGRAEDALAELERALSIHRDDPQLLKLARNAALARGNEIAALDYALRILDAHPENRKNRTTLAQLYLRAGNFGGALVHSEAVVTLAPTDVVGVVLKTKCLVALQRVEEALQCLRDGIAIHPDDESLLILARSLAYQHGRFRESTAYALKLAEHDPTDRKKLDFVAQSYMAAGEIGMAERYVEATQAVPGTPPLKTRHYLKQYRGLKDKSPAVIAAWECSLRNSSEKAVRNPASAELQGDVAGTMIQYWSQGTLPDDVRLVFSAWESLFEREQLGELKLFDRVSAEEWIANNAPAFSRLFASAFHYAMESDIFRIAYASRRPCIYVDIDGWPLESTAEIIRFALRTRASMLYFRSFRPWIVNGFFVSRPDCPFFRELVEQALMVDLAALPKNHDTIETTFGPTRYNKVLLDVLARFGQPKVLPIREVGGCCELAIENERIYFTHEAAAASVKPPFSLGYKGTQDHWKGLSTKA